MESQGRFYRQIRKYNKILEQNNILKECKKL